jgi:hypothetical protein
MVSRVRRVAVVLITALGVGSSVSAYADSSAHRSTAATRRGPLSGSWTGYIGSGSSRQTMAITINALETRGTWQISASCRGTLTLDSISGGYHHFRRHAASGASCAGGDVDCLKRDGAQLYDAVTSHLGGAWDVSGLFKRARA